MAGFLAERYAEQKNNKQQKRRRLPPLPPRKNEDENGFGAGVASALASTYSGYTGFLNAVMGEHDTNQKPIGIFGMQDPADIMTAKQEMKPAQEGFAKLEAEYAPSRNWSSEDIFNDPMGYITDPSGLQYNIGNQVGFMAGSAPVGGLGGGMAKIGLNMVGKNAAKGAFANTMAGKGLNKVVDLANTKAGTGAIIGAGQGGAEAMVEGGLVYRDLIAQGKSPEEASAIALEVAAKNIPTSVASSAAMGGVYGRTVDRFINPTTGSRVLNAGKAFVFGAPMAATPDALQEVVQEGITGQAKGEKVFDIYSPETWSNPLSPEQKSAALQGFIGSAILGGVPSAVGSGIRRPQPRAEEPAPKEKPVIKANATSGNADIDRIIEEKSKQYGIDPNLVHAVIRQESGYRTNVKSSAGAVGLMQLMEGTASDLGVTDRTDPEQNIDGGIRYLKQMYEKNGGDWNAQDKETWEKALASYNGGYGNRNATQTRLYAHDVWDKYNKIKGENAEADTQTEVEAEEMPYVDEKEVENNAIGFAKYKLDKDGEDYSFLNSAIRRNDTQAIIDKYSPEEIQDWADTQTISDAKLNERYEKNRDANIKKILEQGSIKIKDRQMLPFYRQNETFRGGRIKKVKGGYIYTPPKDFLSRADVGRVAEENGITEMAQTLQQAQQQAQSVQTTQDELIGRKTDSFEELLAKARQRREREELGEYEKEYARQDFATVLQRKLEQDQAREESARKEAEAKEREEHQWLVNEIVNDINNRIKAQQAQKADDVQAGLEIGRERMKRNWAREKERRRDAEAQASQAQQARDKEYEELYAIGDRVELENKIADRMARRSTAKDRLDKYVAKKKELTEEEALFDDFIEHYYPNNEKDEAVDAILDKLRQERNERIVDLAERLRGEAAKGVDIIVSDDSDGRGIRQSKNEEWYKKLLNDYGVDTWSRIKKGDREYSLLGIARDMLLNGDEQYEGDPTYIELEDTINGIEAYKKKFDRSADNGRGTRSEVDIRENEYQEAKTFGSIIEGNRETARDDFESWAEGYVDEKLTADRKAAAQRSADTRRLNKEAQQRKEDENAKNQVASQTEVGQDNSTENQDEYTEPQQAQEEVAQNKKPSVELADGYRTESGRPLAEADEREFIVKPNGSMDFGEFDKIVEEESKGRVKAKKIRVQVGFSKIDDKNIERGYGIKHIKKREAELKNLGYSSAENYVESIVNNYEKIYAVPTNKFPNRIQLTYNTDKYNTAQMDLIAIADKDGFYTVVSAIPKNLKREEKEKGTLIYDRSASLSLATNNEAAQKGAVSGENVGATAPSATDKSNVPFVNSTISQKDENVKKETFDDIVKASEVTEETAVVLDAVSEDEGFFKRLSKNERDLLADLKEKFGEDWLSGMREVQEAYTKECKDLIEKYALQMRDRVVTFKKGDWVIPWWKTRDRWKKEGMSQSEIEKKLLNGMRREAAYRLRKRPIDELLGEPFIGEESCARFVELEAVLIGYANIQTKANKHHELQSKGKTSVDIAKADIQGQTADAKTQQRTSGRSEEKIRGDNPSGGTGRKKPKPQAKYTFVIDAEGKNITDLRNALPKQGMVNGSLYPDSAKNIIEVTYYDSLQKPDYERITKLGFKPKDEKSAFDEAAAQQFPLIDKHNERMVDFYKTVRDWCGKQGAGTLKNIVGESRAKYFATERDKNKNPEQFMNFYELAVAKGYKLPKEWQKLYEDCKKGRGDDLSGAKFQIADNSEIKRTFDEIKAEVKKAFPNAKDMKYEGNDIVVSLPNGAKVRVSIRDKIIVNEKAKDSARQAHGVKDNQDIGFQGYWQKVSGSDVDGILAVSKESEEGTTYHESLHMAMDLVLTPQEKKALTDHYAKEAEAKGMDVEETIANGYAKWRKNRENAKFKGVFKKLHDFWHRLKAVFTGIENAHNVMRRIESGEVWERKTDKALRDKNEGDSTFGKIANEKLIRDETEFANSVDAMQKGTLDQTKLVKVMHTPLVLQLIGARDLPIKIKYSDLSKIALDKHLDSKSVENVKKLPRKMADPIAIFRSATREDSYVLMLELESEAGSTYVASVAIDKIENDGGFKINLLTSAYGRGEKKPNDKWFANQVENGNLLYVNTKKARAWSLSKGVQFPEKKLHNGAFLASSIKTETDLVKLRKQHPTKYSVASWAKRKATGAKKKYYHEERVKQAIGKLTGLKVAWGKTDKDVIYDAEQGVIRARVAQDWGNVIPKVAESIAAKLNVGVTKTNGKRTIDPAMRDYITDYILTGALTKAGTQEAKNFEAAMKKKPSFAEDVILLQSEFARYNGLSQSEKAMEGIEMDTESPRSFREEVSQLIVKVVDQYFPIYKMSMKLYSKMKEKGEKLPSWLNPNTIVRNVNGAQQQASLLIQLPQKRFSENATEDKQFIKEHIEAVKDMIRREFPTVDAWLVDTFKPLELILQEAGVYGEEDMARKFSTYMVARRMRELHDRDGRTAEDFPTEYNTKDKCDAVIAELENPAFEQAAKDMYNLQRLGLMIQYDAGLVSRAYIDRVTRENLNYIPLQRVMDDTLWSDDGNSHKRQEGSARRVWAPLDHAMENIAEGFVKAQRNKAMAQLAQAAKLLGQAQTIEVVENNKPQSRNVVSYLVNGERVYIEAHPELACALARVKEPAGASFYLPLVTMANRTSRELLTTHNPEFALTAFFRDAMNFFLYEGGDPIDWLKGIKHTVLRDAVFQEYMTSGASQSVLTAMDKDYFGRNVTGTSKDTFSGLKNTVKSLGKASSFLTDIAEQSIRVAAYEKIKDRTLREELDNLKAELKKQGKTDAEVKQAIQQYGMKDALLTAYTEARLGARDLMDFGTRGEWGAKLNGYAWFANAIIQGGYKSVRALNWKDPANKGKVQSRLLKLASICVLQALISAAGEDDEDIKGLSDEDRYMYFHVKLGDRVWRLPKGDDLGIRTLTYWIDMMFNKRKATLGRTMLPLENAMPSLIMPSIVKPAVEVWMNHSLFYNSEIVPKRLQNPALPEREHDAFTSRVAKGLGETFGWSPKKIDYMMNGYFGGLGRAARGGIDWAVDGKAPKEMVGVRRFLVPEGKASVLVNDAYEYITEQDALYKDWQDRRKHDSSAKPDERFDKAKYSRLKFEKKKMQELTKKIRENRENPRITEAQREANHLAFTKARNKLAESIVFR